MSVKNIISLSLSFMFIGFPSFPIQAKLLKEIKLNEVCSFGINDKDIIYLWSALATDPAQNVYLTDTMDYSIKKYDRYGTFIKKAGQRGQGPGEFNTVRLIAYFDGKLYITDQGNLGIHVFDDNLNFITKIPFNSQIFDFKIIGNDQIAILAPFTATPQEIFLINSKGDATVGPVFPKKSDEHWESFKEFDIDSEGNIYFAYTFVDRIQKYDKNQKSIWVTQLLKGKKVSLRKSQTNFGPSQFPTQVAYKDVALDNFGHIFVLGGHLSEHRSRDIYVLDSKGKHLTTFILPEPSHCIHLDNKNFLYVQSGEGTVIKKYSLDYIYNN